MIINAIAGFALLAWCYLAFFHRGFWRPDAGLPPASYDPTPRPKIAAIVPARDEAPTIGACVSALRAQTYRGAFSVTIVDDTSTDGTATLAREATGAAALNVIAAPPLPEGWTGKLAALQAGVNSVIAADKPDYFWFTDADIVHAPDTLDRLVDKALSDQRDLVSLMVRLHCENFWECLLIPAFIFFFRMLYPFPAANDPRSSTAAAAGGCVLVRRERLEAAGGLAVIKGEIIDDCALANIIKRSGGRLWLTLTNDSQSLRRADSLGPLWAMVRRTAFTQLGYSNLLLAGTLIGLFLVFLGPVMVIVGTPFHRQMLATLGSLATLGLMAWSMAPTLRIYGRSPWEGLLLPVSAGLYAAMTLASGVAHWRHRDGQWKGRHYGPSAPSGNLSKSL